MTTRQIIEQTPNLREIKETDKELYPDLVRVFQKACKGNPLLEYILGTGRRREKKEFHYFNYMLKSGLKYGTVFALFEDEKPYGFGMMVADSRRVYSLPYQIAAGALRMVFGCGLGVVARSLIYERSIGKFRRSQLPENHLYGYFLALAPKKQRDDFRSAKFLMDGAVLFSREKNLLFYFECMSRRHQYYYEKHGFLTAGQFEFKRAGITFYSMRAKEQ